MFNMIIPAFLMGGVICLIGQLLMDLTKPKITPAHVLVGFVCGGAILGALGWYKPLIDIGGAGASIPLSGFGYTLAKGPGGCAAARPDRGFFRRRRGGRGGHCSGGPVWLYHGDRL